MKATWNGVTIAESDDWNAQPQTKAVEKDHAQTWVNGDLVTDNRVTNDFVACRVFPVENERAVRPIRRNADRKATVSAEIEGVHDEPFASALRRIESVDGKPRLRWYCLRERRRCDERGSDSC